MCNHPESTYAKRGLCRKRTGVGWGGGGVLLKAYVRFPISGMKMLILSFVQKHHTFPLPLEIDLGIDIKQCVKYMKIQTLVIDVIAMPVYLERLAQNP